jgi:hypothetical protein
MPVPLIQGKNYAVVGKVIQWNGLTEVSPTTAAGIVDLGVGVLPEPLTVLLPQSPAQMEALEGRLVRIENLRRATNSTNSWTAGKTIGAVDASNNPIDIRIQNDSTATNSVGFPVTVVGILGQYDTSSPRDSGYQIMPRAAADLTFTGRLELSLSSDVATLREGVTEAVLTVTRSGTAAGTLTVNLGQSLSGALEADIDSDGLYEAFPSEITILAGQSSFGMLYRVKNDAVANGNRSLTITATSGGFENGTLLITLEDDDLPAGSTFAGWSGGAELNSANVGKYAIGGATNSSAASERPVAGVDSNVLSLTAIVRTNDGKLSVVGEAGGSLTNWSTNGVSNAVAGSQAGVPDGCQRQVFSVERTNSPSRQFLRLKATLAP